MTINVYWVDSLKIPYMREFGQFLNAMSSRIAQGHARYGIPRASANYAKKMALELADYQDTGNIEHLYNIANYAYLETIAPGHKKQHLDNTVGSATRGKV